MQTSVLKRLLHPIKALKSLAAKRPLAETSEPREESKVQSEECRVQSYEYTSSTDEVGPPSPTGEGNVQNECPTCEVTEEQSEDSAAATEVDTDKSASLSHLTSSVPRAARVPRGALSKSEMTELRELFGGLSDAEIQRLYKRVTK